MDTTNTPNAVIGRPVSRGWLAGLRHPFGGGEPNSWWQSVGAIALGIVVALGTLNLIGAFAMPLALLVLGIVVGESMTPLVGAFNRVFPRPLAVVLVYFLFFGVVALLILLMIPIVAGQIREFGAYIPAVTVQARQWLESRRLPIGPTLRINAQTIQTLLTQAGPLAGTLLKLPGAVATALVQLGLVLIISIYWQMEAPGRKRFFLSLFPGHRREQAAIVAHRMGYAMGGYMRGVMIESGLVGVLTFLGLLILGIPYSLMLGALAGMLEIVPTLGPVLAAAPIVASAWVQSPAKAFAAVAFIIVLQQVEAHLLMPLVMRGQTRVTPLTAVVALFTGGAIGGFMGVLIAIPVVAALRVFVEQVGAPVVRRWAGAPPDVPAPLGEEKVPGSEQAEGQQPLP